VPGGGGERTEADYRALARAVLSGRLVEQRAEDPYPVEWLFRTADSLVGSPQLAWLTRGVAGCLRDADPLVRRQAMLFFRERPQAIGAEQVEETVAHDRALLAAVPDPLHPGDTMEAALLDALAARLPTDSPRALALARAIVLEPGKALPLAAALTRQDPDWTAAHAEDIVRGTPSAAIAILVQLERLERDYAALGERLAPLADAAFADDVGRFLTDDKAKARVLRAIP
jgi:hypothetical protein